MSKMHNKGSGALLALAAALSVAGCGPVNRGMESIKQPVVQRADHVFDLAAGYDGLAPGETERLRGWFDAVGLRYGDRVAVDDRAGAGGQAAQNAVAGVAGQYGLLLQPTAPVTAGEVPAGSVRVVVSRTTANVADCPDWRGSALPDFTSSTGSNFGCATNRNLAAMIADPEDLVRGRVPGSSVDAAAAGKAVRLYRDRAATGAQALQGQATGGAN